MGAPENTPLDELITALVRAPRLPASIAHAAVLYGHTGDLDQLLQRDPLDRATLELLLERIRPRADAPAEHRSRLALLLRRPDLPLELLVEALGPTPPTEILIDLVARADLLDVLLERATHPSRSALDRARVLAALLLRCPTTPTRIHQLALRALTDLDQASPESPEHLELLTALANSHALRTRPLETLLLMLEHPSPHLVSPALHEIHRRSREGWPGTTLGAAPDPSALLERAPALVEQHLLTALDDPAPLPDSWWRAAESFLPLASPDQVSRVGTALSRRPSPETDPTRAHRSQVRALAFPDPSLEQVLERAAHSSDPLELTALANLAALAPQAALALACNPHVSSKQALSLARKALGPAPDLTLLPRENTPILSERARTRAESLLPLLHARASDREFLASLFRSFPLLLAALPAHLGAERARALLLLHLQHEIDTPTTTWSPTSRDARLVLVLLLEGRFDDVPVPVLVRLAPLDSALATWLGEQLTVLGSPLEPTSAAAWSLLAQLLESFSGTLSELLDVVHSTLAQPRTSTQ